MKKSMMLILLLILLLLCTACSSQQTAGEVSAVMPTAAPTEVPTAEVADDAIIIDNKTDTLIYEDENFSFSVKWINIGGVTASIEKKVDGKELGFFLEDMVIDGHAVNMKEYSYKDKTYVGNNFTTKYSVGGLMTIFGPASRSDIVDWPGGSDITEISFTLRAVDTDMYPEGDPNVSQRFTIRLAQ